MFSKTTLAVLPLLHQVFSAPTAELVTRDGAGSIVTSATALTWYSSSLTAGTSGLSTPSDYTCYSGAASNFPAFSTWVNFGTMWNNSLQYTLNLEPNTKAQNTDIYNAIVATSKAAKVDARVILATILLESSGNLSVPCTVSPHGGIPNCGLMQSFNGSSFSAATPVKSINQMVTDGTQGTAYGPGLVQLFNDASDSPGLSKGNPYVVFREYNSGNANLADLSNAYGANPAYVSDMANYLQGWNGYGTTPSTCTFNATAPVSPTPTCAASSYVSPPAATVSGTTPDCCSWYVPVSGDSCYSVDTAHNISFAQFQSWNTYIDAACDNLWANTAYCVNGVVEAAAPSTTSSSVVASTKTVTSSSSKATSTKATTTKATSTKATSTKASSTKASSTRASSTKATTSTKVAKAKKSKTAIATHTAA